MAGALRAGNLELRVLQLSHNNLGNKTAAAFGDLLESSHTLKELDLGWNQIKVGRWVGGVDAGVGAGFCGGTEVDFVEVTGVVASAVTASVASLASSLQASRCFGTAM